ncbi:MAG: tryptophan synthase subunit alpha [Lautropia sp.]|nr:tryptophan synthase subunit alpha [Lautropia sp.]
MSRISATFEKLKATSRRALIPYITSGFPEPASTVPLMHALVENGADIIELGVPFSDPMADGPVIQRAGDKALAAGIGLGDVMDYVKAFRSSNDSTPVVLMGYCNPVERMGLKAFAERAAAVGVDGVLLVDCPPEEAAEFAAEMRSRRIDPIFLLAPTSSEARFRQVAQLASGYVYYVSLKGVTGAANIDIEEVARQVPKIQQATGLPVGVGFGIKDGPTAARVSVFADAVVIGSRLIEVLEQGGASGAQARAGELIGSLRAAMDARMQAQPRPQSQLQPRSGGAGKRS